MLTLVAPRIRPETNTYIAAAITAGGSTPTARRVQVVNTFIRGLITHGLWSKLDRVWLLASHGNVFARTSVRNPSSTLITAVNTPTFTIDRGYAGVPASSAYLDTNFNPATQGSTYTQNAATRAYYLVTRDTTNTVIDGVSGSANNGLLSAASNQQRINQAGNMTDSLDMRNTGYVGLTRVNGTNILAMNGTTPQTTTATSQAVQSTNQFILRRNTTYGGHQLGFAAMGGALNQTEHLNLRLIVRGYLTAVGAINGI